MAPDKPSFQMATQYFQTLPCVGTAYVFAADRFGVELAIGAAYSKGLQIAGVVVPASAGALPCGNLVSIPVADLATLPFDFVLVAHPDLEQEQIDCLVQADIPESKILPAYTDRKFSSWVKAREIYRKHREVDNEFEDLLAYRSEGAFLEIAAACSPYTVTSLERMFALYKSIRYSVMNNIQGAFVECGVWNAGSSMVAALTYLEMGITDRDLYLFDTFAGMTKPDDNDTDLYGTPSQAMFERDQRENHNEWCYGSIETVTRNMLSTGYPETRIHYVVGDVEKTLPCDHPEKIAVLRLDTDWYASTLHELRTLYPKLQKNGVLIIDDYGHWAGARKAVDEYFKDNPEPILLNRIDYTGRVAVKTV